MIDFAECTGMDKAYKAELIHALCLKEVEKEMPGIDPERGKSLAKIKAESLLYSYIYHKDFDEILERFKN